jgi:transcriptional regulator with XRE-family HTH domain
VTTIPLLSDRQIGPTLRTLRHNAGLSLRQLGLRTRLSPSAIQKRERSAAGYVGILIEHVRPLGYTVALIPQRHPGARDTGTGWPA